MQSTAKTEVENSLHPLDPSQFTRLQQALEGLSGDQLTWASGYLAGLSGLSPAARPASEKAPGMTILYATQGGNARSVAEALAESAASRGLVPRLVAADQYRPRDIVKEKLLVVVICTQGEGEPPESARELFKFLNGRKPPELSQLQYAIFGLGDSSYEYFCQAAKDLDGLLKARGAHGLVDRIDADVDFNLHTETWSQQVLKEAEKSLPAEQAQVIPIQRVAAGQRYDRNRPFQAELLERRRITTPDAMSEVYHLSLEINANAIRYQPGDALGVYFQNDSDLIGEILSLTGLSGETEVDLQGETMTLVQALTERLELTQLHPSVVTAWAAIAGDARLQALSGNGDALRQFARGRQFIDLLQDYPAKPDAESLVKLLQPLQPRLYSIASSQSAGEDEIHLTVSAFRYRAHGRDHLGGASGYLTQRIGEGDKLGVYVAENPSFRLPQSGETPIVMIGAGTGIAPFRAFLQEREVQAGGGANWLVFGNRHFHRDFLYQTDWINYRKAGLLNRITLAFSRDDAERSYVQSRLAEEGAELFRWLQEGAHLYVCGALEMEQSVCHTLQEILQAHGGLEAEAAADYIESLREQGRYQRDVY
ncbi:MAG: assimilatory sulfite reductase (NADPH) flavoprotein subunit [Candidatus Thiodiazotropha sp.]